MKPWDWKIGDYFYLRDAPDVIYRLDAIYKDTASGWSYHGRIAGTSRECIKGAADMVPCAAPPADYAPPPLEAAAPLPSAAAPRRHVATTSRRAKSAASNAFGLTKLVSSTKPASEEQGLFG